MKKTRMLLALVPVLILQVAIVTVAVVRQELDLAQGAVLRLPVRPVDPYDAFRGRYLQLALDLEAPPGTAAGVWHFPANPDRVTVLGEVPAHQGQVPAHPAYLSLNCRIRFMDTSAESLVWEFTDGPLQYFLKEDLAMAADARLPAILATGTHSLELEGRAMRGRFMPQRLLLDGVPVQESPLMATGP